MWITFCFLSSFLLDTLVVAFPPQSDTTGRLEDISIFSASNASLVELEDALAKGKGREAATPLTNLRYAFMRYEGRMKRFFQNAKKEGQSLKNVDIQIFWDELRSYMDLLPRNETREVTKKYREKCYCDGRFWTPCPESCVNSCYAHMKGLSGPRYIPDCRGLGLQGDLFNCFCYNGSTHSCDNGNFIKCFDEKTELEQISTPCPQYAIDRDLIEKSYSMYVDLLVEPYKRHVRKMENKISSFKQKVIATDSLLNYMLNIAECDKLNETCFPEAPEIMNQTQKSFTQLKRDIAQDIMRLQKSVDTVSLSIVRLKEKVISQVQATVENYTRCRTGLTFNMQEMHDNETTQAAASSLDLRREPKRPTTTSSTPTSGTTLDVKSDPTQPTLSPPTSTTPFSMFECHNGEYIKLSWRCDGDYDCDDETDEENCMSPPTSTTPSSMFECHNGEYILLSWRCDGDYDCADQTDEENCMSPPTSTTPSSMFRCYNGEYINLSWHCDGDYDCADQTDEENCMSPPTSTTPSSMFECRNGEYIKLSWRCDGDYDCADQTDEEN